MKRFHVHLHVDDLQASIAFYSKLFAAQPARIEGDYAKWMLDDPRVNFAISTRGAHAGLDHLGFQTDDPQELAELKARAEAADMALLDEGETTCCYARSDKHWITDPQGIAWEHFHTLGSIPVFSEAQADSAAACCAPTAPLAAESTCCAPAKEATPRAAVTGCTPQASAAAASSCCAPAAPVAAESGCCAPAAATSTRACCG
jgi:catechol 2,3-dioxygenase-like lactoylglutathione lyase family enzyme